MKHHCSLALPILLSLALVQGCTGLNPKASDHCDFSFRGLAYFGLSRPDEAEVSEGDWKDFVEGTISVSFPSGFTVLDGAGAWRDGDSVAFENSKVLVVLSSAKSLSSQLETVAENYRVRFDQQSVITEVYQTCGNLAM